MKTTPKKVADFIENNLVYINRTDGVIDWVDVNGNNMETEFSGTVYNGINLAVKRAKKIKLVVY